MATKYVVELTKEQFFMIMQAMETHNFVGCVPDAGTKKIFNRTELALVNRKTKEKYLRETVPLGKPNA